MSLVTVDRSAWPELKALSISTFQTREVELECENFFNCVDEACLAAVRPLLTKMRLDNVPVCIYDR